MLNDNDPPLGDQFLQNPYEYLQSFVRNMNNQVFLSEYQLGYLYSLLLLKIQTPWDDLKPNNPNMKAQVEQMVNKKIVQVKKLLESLSQLYEDKVKKNNFNQIERLMSILKANNKSIFIERDLSQLNHQAHQIRTPQGKQIKKQIKQKLLEGQIVEIQKEKSNQNIASQSISKGKNESECQTSNCENLQNHHQHTMQQQGNEPQNSRQSAQNTQSQKDQHQHEEQSHLMNILSNQGNNDDKEVLTLFYGISNLSNLSTLALGNCLEYSSAERYIKFKMSKNYLMTIKNEDQQYFDSVSTLKNVSSDLYIHHLFPYLTSVQLFNVRAVCNEWMQNVKQAWHSTFKRQMFIQLMACEFCKQIEHYYKLIQLRNPFFQKVSLLMHALLQIIQWDKVYESINNNTILPQLKKVLIILLKLLGEDIVTQTLNSITEQVWLQHKQKTLNLKQKLSQFLNSLESSILSIRELMKIKINLLDDPFMRVQQLNSDDKTPLLLVILIKQLTLQQILKNNIYFSQEYLMNTKRKLDNVSSKMPQQKGFLQGVYKILLLRNLGGDKRNKKQEQEQEQRSQMPNFQQLLHSIFSPNQQSNKPDFVIKHKSSFTNIYMDKATKLDIIVSTVKKMNAVERIYSQTQQLSENMKVQPQVQVNQERVQIASQVNSQEKNYSHQNQQQPKIQLKTVNQYNIKLAQKEQSSEKQPQSNEKSEQKKTI